MEKPFKNMALKLTSKQIGGTIVALFQFESKLYFSYYKCTEGGLENKAFRKVIMISRLKLAAINLLTKGYAAE